MKHSTAHRLRWSLLASALCLLLLGAVALINIRRFGDAERRHTHTYDVLVEGHLLSRALSDMDIGARDYALGGALGDLERLRESESSFSLHLNRMIALTTVPEVRQRLQTLHQLQSRWAESFIRPIETMRSSKTGKTSLVRLAQLVDATAIDAPLNRQMRATLRDIEKIELSLLQERSAAQSRLRRISAWTLIIGAGVLAFIVATLSLSLIQRVEEVSKSNIILQNEMAQREMMQGSVLESQLLFHTFMDNNPAVAFMKDAGGRMTYVNKPLEKMFGVAAGELLGKTDDQWLPAEAARAIMEHDRDVLQSGQPREIIEIAPTPDGVERQWLVFKFPFFNRDGEQFLGGLGVDVTERRKIEDALKNSQANLSALIENTNDGIWSVDRQYRAIIFNEAFGDAIFARFGIRPEVGQAIVDLVGEPARTQWINLYERAFAGEHFSIEESRQTDAGITDSEIVFNPIISDGVITGATVFTRDITERKKIERLKSEFISTVSHELRTPLTSIRGALGLLAGGVVGALPEAAERLVEIAVSNSERLVRLINDILDMEKIESGKLDLQLHPLQIVPLVRESLEANRAYAQTLDVHFVLENRVPENAQVLADADRLTQVLTNLLSNAAKFSPRESEVQIQIEETLNADASRAVRVSVRDKGAGVPPEFHDRIFHKFAQADASDTRQKGGTGLGLSISKALIEKLGGTIGFDSVPNEGATFFFEVPLWMESTPELRRTFAGAARRILICEDDEEVAQWLLLLVRQIGFEADIAAGIAQATQMLQSRRYAAMTLDLMLPDGDGVSLIRRLRADAATRDLPIVVVSAQTMERRGELNGEAVSIVDWLEKPIDTTRLLAAVRQAALRDDGAQPHILHVEDDDDILHVVATILEPCGRLDSAKTLREATARLAARDYDLVILDVGLPDGSGLDLLPLLSGRQKPIPVVIFSARDLSHLDAQTAQAALVKSRTSNEQLRETIEALLHTQSAQSQSAGPQDAES